jgi:two-component system NtrC family sensor kinase
LVEVAIKDTGCGMPDFNMQRIFDPFFTSKEVGKGTGLGLSVSYGIVKAHGGEIKVASGVGQGTPFRILLPVMSPFSESELSPVEKAQ